MFTLRYEYGHDRINGAYNTVGGFVTVGFSLENMLSGGSPFTLPEPVFKSPRDLRRLLGLKVKRNWYQPAAVVLARSSANQSPPAPSTLTTTANVGNLGPTGSPNDNVTVSLTPSVSLVDTAGFSSLTITFSNAKPLGVGFVRLITDTGGITNVGVILSGTNTVTITKAANPTFFGGGGITGTIYNQIIVDNLDFIAGWNAGIATLVWQ